MANEPITIIGVDCATEDVRVGLALGRYAEGRTALIESTTASPQQPALQTILRWLDGAQLPALLALDAPLGWPAQLVQALHEHQAGQPIDAAPKQLFRRDTDTFIHGLVQKLPLEVGADRIARTAHAALRLLGQLRAARRLEIPLAWQHHLGQDVYAIEVYPAATLRAHGFLPRRYGADSAALEQAIIDMVAARMAGTELLMAGRRHAIDAALCVLAGSDFVQGRASPPRDLQLARKEGWIWTKAP